MNPNPNPQLSSDDLKRGANAASAELQAARADYSKCAYNYALDRENEETRKALLNSKQRLDVLSAELEGLGAATSEAERIERIAGAIAVIDELETQRTEAKAAADATHAAFERVMTAIGALGAAHRELVKREKASSVAELRCRKAGSNAWSDLHPTKYVEGLIKAALGAPLSGAPDAAKVEQMIATFHERATDRIDAGIDEKAAGLRERVARLEARG